MRALLLPLVAVGLLAALAPPAAANPACPDSAPSGIIFGLNRLVSCLLHPDVPSPVPPPLPHVAPAPQGFELALPCYSLGAWPDVCLLLVPAGIPAVLDCEHVGWQAVCQVLPAL